MTKINLVTLDDGRKVSRQRRWQIQNPEKERAMKHAYYKSEHYRAKNREWYHANKHRFIYIDGKRTCRDGNVS